MIGFESHFSYIEIPILRKMWKIDFLLSSNTESAGRIQACENLENKKATFYEKPIFPSSLTSA